MTVDSSTTKLGRVLFVFISLRCEPLMNPIDVKDFVALITASISITFTWRELNSSNLYGFRYDRYNIITVTYKTEWCQQLLEMEAKIDDAISKP